MKRLKSDLRTARLLIAQFRGELPLSRSNSGELRNRVLATLNDETMELEERRRLAYKLATIKITLSSR